MDVSLRPLLVVAVQGERFGLETARVRTVAEYREPAPIPGRPAPFVGALNHRGHLLPVVPLAALLGLEHRLDPDRSAVVVLDWDDALLGLVVERTHGLLGPQDRARTAEVLGRWEGPHLEGSYEVEGQRVHVLDVDSLLADVAGRL